MRHGEIAQHLTLPSRSGAEIDVCTQQIRTADGNQPTGTLSTQEWMLLKDLLAPLPELRPISFRHEGRNHKLAGGGFAIRHQTLALQE
jgi:hypothetical protein